MLSSRISVPVYFTASRKLFDYCSAVFLTKLSMNTTEEKLISYGSNFTREHPVEVVFLGQNLVPPPAVLNSAVCAIPVRMRSLPSYGDASLTE